MHSHSITDCFTDSLTRGRTFQEDKVGQTVIVWGSRIKQGRQRIFQNSPKGGVILAKLTMGFLADTIVLSTWTGTSSKGLVECEAKGEDSCPSLLSTSLLKLFT